MIRYGDRRAARAAWQTESVTGATSSTVVTLSRIGDGPAVTRISSVISRAGRPRDVRAAHSARNSKSPVCLRIPTITIIPKSRKMTFQSTPVSRLKKALSASTRPIDGHRRDAAERRSDPVHLLGGDEGVGDSEDPRPRRARRVIGRELQSSEAYQPASRPARLMARSRVSTRPAVASRRQRAAGGRRGAAPWSSSGTNRWSPRRTRATGGVGGEPQVGDVHSGQPGAGRDAELEQGGVDLLEGRRLDVDARG